MLEPWICHAWHASAVRRIPCAVHRPPHQMDRWKSAGKCRSVLTALIKALCKEARGAAKGVPKHAPEAREKSARHVPKRLKIDEKWSPSSFWAAFGSQEAPKSTKDAPKRRPRGAQERPRAAQERPRAAQETPGRRPNPSQIDPGALQDLILGRS